MPNDLEEECLKMHLPPFRANEIVSLPPVTVNNKQLHHPNITATIEKMVSLGVLANDRTSTVQTYIEVVKPMLEKYSCLVDTWPFELPRMLLEKHHERLDKIRRVCATYLEQKYEEALDVRLEAPAQNGGQDGAPNGNPQEQFRQGNSQGGGPI
jgi:hypothetical protein